MSHITTRDVEEFDNESDRLYDEARDNGTLPVPSAPVNPEFDPERVNGAIRRLRELGVWK